MDIGAQPRLEPPAPPSIATLLVSLFLVLLTFFILLSSFATIDAKKSKNILRNVNQTFAKGQQDITQSFSKTASIEAGIAELSDELQYHIGSIMPLEHVQFQTEGSVLRLRLPAIELFDEGSLHLRQDREAFYDDLAEILRRWHKNAIIEMRFLQETNNTSPLHIARGGDFARFMENKGVSPQSITPGIQSGTQEMVVFEFDLRVIRTLPDKMRIAP